MIILYVHESCGSMNPVDLPCFITITFFHALFSVEGKKLKKYPKNKNLTIKTMKIETNLYVLSVISSNYKFILIIVVIKIIKIFHSCI